MAIINHDLLNKLYWEEKDGKDFRLRLGKQNNLKINPRYSSNFSILRQFVQLIEYSVVSYSFKILFL
jgi:hypothetical protein